MDTIVPQRPQEIVAPQNDDDVDRDFQRLFCMITPPGSARPPLELKQFEDQFDKLDLNSSFQHRGARILSDALANEKIKNFIFETKAMQIGPLKMFDLSNKCLHRMMISKSINPRDFPFLKMDLSDKTLIVSSKEVYILCCNSVKKFGEIFRFGHCISPKKKSDFERFDNAYSILQGFIIVESLSHHLFDIFNSIFKNSNIDIKFDDITFIEGVHFKAYEIIKMFSKLTLSIAIFKKNTQIDDISLYSDSDFILFHSHNDIQYFCYMDFFLSQRNIHSIFDETPETPKRKKMSIDLDEGINSDFMKGIPVSTPDLNHDLDLHETFNTPSNYTF